MKIEKIQFNGYRIGIPIPFPMKYVYCYVFAHEGGYVLIDTGLNNQAAKAAWREAFQELKITPTQIKTIFLTHFHPDHAGLSGWMQELTGADVYMHKLDKEMMEHVWQEEQQQSELVGAMVREHGTPQELSEQIVQHMERLRKMVLPLPEVKEISAVVEFAGEQWRVLHTPGHSNGHICFYQETEKVLISGDHILDKISPNISVWPKASQEPLHEYVQSLQQIKELGIKVALPAHGKPILEVNKRVDELVRHHEERLRHIEELADDTTAYTIAEKLFAEKTLNPHQWRFAIAEIIAHLHYLDVENRVIKSSNEPISYKKRVLNRMP